ncbi:MAG: hypothetical protein MRY79_08135 [Alphaproteobacteria bacterium]|nr:hypothetical protein [Alphaproteobacteria bacterium]
MIRIFLILVVMLGGCLHVGGLNLAQYSQPQESYDDFVLCHGYGCTEKTRIGFHESEWSTVLNIFDSSAATPEQERMQIAKAIALLERMSAELAGTGEDQPKAPILRSSNKELDCIDETVNTSKYLGFLEAAGVLKFHEGGEPAYKGYLIDGTYPHNTATIIERETGEIYVVDSYIYAGGQEPDIRSLNDWLVRRVE